MTSDVVSGFRVAPPCPQGILNFHNVAENMGKALGTNPEINVFAFFSLSLIIVCLFEFVRALQIQFITEIERIGHKLAKKVPEFFVEFCCKTIISRRLTIWKFGKDVETIDIQSINQAIFTHGIPSLQMLFQRAVS